MVKMGIIDYFRLYTWDKKLEEVTKRAINKGNTPTIISPNNYRTRFLEAISKYFVENYD